MIAIMMKNYCLFSFCESMKNIHDIDIFPYKYNRKLGKLE